MKRKIIILVFACITAFTCLCLVTTNTYAFSSNDLTTPLNISDGIYDEYTDSDYLLYLGPNSIVDTQILEYKTKYESYTLNRSQDNPIVQIIPKELFVHRGTYTYVGKEYGFFVETRANTDFSNISTVLVFDIINETTLVNLDKATITLQPLFCYDFVYLTKAGDFQYKAELYTYEGAFQGLSAIITENITDPAFCV